MDEVRLTQESLGNFIDASPTMFQAESNLRETFLQSGAILLNEQRSWNLQPGNTYLVSRDNSALIAFRLGEAPLAQGGFRVAGAHTDSPMLKAKNLHQGIEKGYLFVATEVYGGPILSAWLDRELLLCGTAKVRNEHRVDLVPFALPEAVGIIPNLAIHLNREINKGFEYNAQDHLRVLIFASIPEKFQKSPLEYLISQKLGIEPSRIEGGDWFFSPVQKSTLLSDPRYTIFGPRIDNLAGCHSVLRGFLQAVPGDATQIAVFYNHEEIGSSSTLGANSQFFLHTLQRLIGYSAQSHEDFYITLARSMQISIDAAHSVHPNFVSKFDSAYTPEMGKGPVVKQSATQRYASNPITERVVEELALEHSIPLQYMTNRSDIPSGTTIGPLSAIRSDMRTVDIGIPIFAMHSTRETASGLDQHHMIHLLRHFYESESIQNERI